MAGIDRMNRERADPCRPVAGIRGRDGRGGRMPGRSVEFFHPVAIDPLVGGDRLAGQGRRWRATGPRWAIGRILAPGDDPAGGGGATGSHGGPALPRGDRA